VWRTSIGKVKKILLADDVELFLELERNFLQREDLDLLIAKDGRKALEMIRQHSPQIAFLGLKMPGMSGEECCRTIKEDPSLRSTTVAMNCCFGAT
jgi:CheY-like chemotaxis protein